MNRFLNVNHYLPCFGDMLNSYTFPYSNDETRQYGLVISVPDIYAVGHGFASRLSHTKYHHKNGTYYLPVWHACSRVGLCHCCPTV